MIQASDWLERIRALPLPERVRIMNVCGGHERSKASNYHHREQN
jgi:hydrogenase expression/formation protein HypD